MRAEPKRPYYKKRKKARKRKTRDDWTVTDWKKCVWKLFSHYIRLRDCIETTGTSSTGKCVTCGRTYPFGKLQAGHFMPGRMDCILFEEQAVHAQCYRCNVTQSGMWPAYYIAMEKKYGFAWIASQLDKWDTDTKKYTINELKAMEPYYKMEIARIEEAHLRREWK